MTVGYARAKLALGVFFALFGIVMIVQGSLRVGTHGLLATSPLLVLGALMIGLGFVRYKQYRSVMDGR
jgi:drug/metabolite transporter (DMT)-like permease